MHGTAPVRHRPDHRPPGGGVAAGSVGAGDGALTGKTVRPTSGLHESEKFQEPYGAWPAVGPPTPSSSGRIDLTRPGRRVRCRAGTRRTGGTSR
jgi:hypothetical protein